MFGDVDWAALVLPGTPILEILVRGTATYLGLFVLLRLAARREAGSLGMLDMLVIVLLADAAQNAMAGEYSSLADGAVLVGTIVAWNYVLEWVAFHVPQVEHIMHPPPSPLIKNGQMMRRNMRQELVTEAELMSSLRLQGVEDVRQVKMACMETDGRLSVVKFDGQDTSNERRRFL